VDCVGACVGMKGMRVQSIIRELRGEKIDIIEYSDDPVVFATHALSPAKISRVSIVTGADKHMEVIVDDTQLSLAIGKKGQNVRLAAKLLGWKIDIKSEEEKRQEVESAMSALVPTGAPVSVLMMHDLSGAIVDKLATAGVGTIEKLGSMTPEELETIEGIDPRTIEKIFAAVNSYYGQFEETPPSQAAEIAEAVPESVNGEVAAEQHAAAEDAAPAAAPADEPGAGEELVTDAAFAHLSVAPSELAEAPHAVSSVGEGEFDTMKDSENAG
jgi:N utilization substance protein A